jgi:hypothetical protein
MINKLPWITYGSIWVVGVGYWVMPPDRSARTTPPRAAVETVHADMQEKPVAPIAMATLPALSPTGPVAAPSAPPEMNGIDASSPEFLERIRPVLNRGTNLAAASAQFRDATEFAAVAHAARNTKVPFVVLKHRVLKQGMTLADAIRASLPQADAKGEADLAIGEARSDVAASRR